MHVTSVVAWLSYSSLHAIILLGNFDPANEAVPGGSRSGDRDSGSCEQQLGQQGKHLSYCTVST
jgi:hypothetical protein